MQHHDPVPCPACGHLVYEPLIASVRGPQQSCRAVVSGHERCDCADATHRTHPVRPRHRREVLGV